jgi:hypothetical protein
MSEREEVFRKIQLACAGHLEQDIIQALLHSVVVIMGVSAPSLERAEAAIDALPVELKMVLRQKWEAIRKHRERADRRNATIDELKKGL